LLPAQTIFRKSFGVTVLRAANPNRPASGKKRPAATPAKITRLLKGDFTTKTLKHHGLGLGTRAQRSAYWTIALLQASRLLTAIDQLPLAQLPTDLVTDFGG
jgi:hypothetical protein